MPNTNTDTMNRLTGLYFLLDQAVEERQEALNMGFDSVVAEIEEQIAEIAELIINHQEEETNEPTIN